MGQLYVSCFFKKDGPTSASFCLFTFFSNKKLSKNFSLQLDSNSIVRVDGVHADHLTTTATHSLRLMFEFTQWTQKELGVKWLKNGSAQVLKKFCQKWHDVCSLANCSHLNRCPGDLKKKQQKPLAQRSDQLSDKKFENLFFWKDKARAEHIVGAGKTILQNLDSVKRYLYPQRSFFFYYYYCSTFFSSFIATADALY